MEAMNNEELQVGLLITEEDTLVNTLPTHNRTFHRVTPVSLACQVLAIPNLLR